MAVLWPIHRTATRIAQVCTSQKRGSQSRGCCGFTCAAPAGYGPPLVYQGAGTDRHNMAAA